MRLPIPENIKHIRNLLGLSQPKFGELFALSRGQIASYEDGRAHPPIHSLVRMSETLEIPVDLLAKQPFSNPEDSNYQIIKNHVLDLNNLKK